MRLSFPALIPLSALSPQPWEYQSACQSRFYARLPSRAAAVTFRPRTPRPHLLAATGPVSLCTCGPVRHTPIYLHPVAVLQLYNADWNEWPYMEMERTDEGQDWAVSFIHVNHAACTKRQRALWEEPSKSDGKGHIQQTAAANLHLLAAGDPWICTSRQTGREMKITASPSSTSFPQKPSFLDHLIMAELKVSSGL